MATEDKQQMYLVLQIHITEDGKVSVSGDTEKLGDPLVCMGVFATAQKQWMGVLSKIKGGSIVVPRTPILKPI